MTQHVLSGDIHSPSEAKAFLDSVSAAFSEVASTDEQSGANLAREGVTGPAVELTAGMHAASTLAASAAISRAARFADHIARRDEHISDDLAGTQSGKYLDPAAQ